MNRTALKIYDTTTQDWERTGAYNNYMWGMPVCASLKLLPFITPNINTNPFAMTIDTFEARKVEFSNGEKSYTGDVYTLLTTLLTDHTSATKTFYSFAGSIAQVEFDKGYYEFYIKIVSGAATLVE